MKLTALYYTEAKRRHWIVRWLRYMGFLIVLAATLAAILYGGNLVTPLVQQMLRTDSNGVAVLVLVLSAILGLAAGLVISLPWWGLSMLLDDLHAIRLQTAAYVSQDRE